jgi:shikimate kinase
MRIYLVGLMGSGKTTAGKALAKKLGISFHDLDDIIEAQIGMTISEYFEQFGEDKFRKVEQECLRKTFGFEDVVIATGGGAPCFFNNMEEIKNNGISFYLKANVNLLCSRLIDAKSKRPLISDISNEQLAENLKGLLVKREPYYEKADYAVNAMDPLHEMLQIIRDYLKIE